MDRQYDNWRRDAEGVCCLSYLSLSCCPSGLYSAIFFLALLTELNNAISDNNTNNRTNNDKDAWQQRLLNLKKQADNIYEDLPSYERRKQAEVGLINL